MPRINAVSFHENPSLESICRKVRAAGFTSLELSRPPFYQKLTTPHLRQRFAEWAADLGLKLFGFDCWIDVRPYDRFDETLADFQAAVDWAADLSLGMVISHDPWASINGDRPARECLSVNVELFQRMADFCAAKELLLVLEPHPDTLSINDDFACELIDTIDRENCGILYDCCHYGVGQPSSYLSAIKQLGRRIRHLHFSDGDAVTYALHLPLGDGVLDLPGIIAALNAIQFRGTLTNDLYNYPLLEEGARRNAMRIEQVEQQLGLTAKPETA